ncbi:MAG: Guanylate kinase [Tenericutes bacterium ADurb.BinA155]|jgi:guanylate kinase|nr:MAG: Guanylate kinase [Tenericutes bacterium ADurb.BinA155]
MILLVGASASGKTEIAKYLRSRYGIVKAITHTSRLPRVGEKDGVDYFFVSEDAFKKLMVENKLVEHTYYNGHYYGCSKSQVNDDKCVVVDPNGLKNFLALEDPRLITFYLEAPEAVREKRMIGRGDDPKLIKERLVNDRTAFSKGKILPTDFTIETGDRSIEEIGDDIYSKYMAALTSRD